MYYNNYIIPNNYKYMYTNSSNNRCIVPFLVGGALGGIIGYSSCQSKKPYYPYYGPYPYSYPLPPYPMYYRNKRNY